MNAASPRSKAVQRFGLRLVLISSGLLLAAIPLLILLILVRSGWEPLHRLDFTVAASLNAYISAHLGQVKGWQAVSIVLGPTVLRASAAIAAVVLWFRGRRRLALLVVVAVAGAAVLSGVTKALVHRVRPIVNHPVDHASGGSFPSGHAMTSMVVLGLAVVILLPRVPRRWRTVIVATAAVLVVAVGFSRLILGVHYVSDVVGGWIIGVAWLLIVVGAVHTAAADPPEAESPGASGEDGRETGALA
jgi:membrane-associated phospholipid phosphatase